MSNDEWNVAAITVANRNTADHGRQNMALCVIGAFFLRQAAASCSASHIVIKASAMAVLVRWSS